MNGKANIVYLHLDQLKASATHFMGNPHAHTPFMDRMAASGIVFSSAYSPSPICTPSRTSVFTGVHPLVHQVTCHVNRAPYNLQQVSELFYSAGYCTAVAGHYELSRNLSRGWHEQVNFREPGPLLNSYLTLRNSGRRDVGWSAGGLGCSAEEGNSYLLTNRALRILDEIRKVKSPFFFHVAYNDPHPPYFAPSPYDTLVDPNILSLPAQGQERGRPHWQNICREQCGTDQATDYDIKKVVALYYGKIAYGDAQMQRVYQGLEERRMLDNTWVIISSDHGDYAGEKGLFTKTESLYECLLHVPLIIVPPEGVPLPRGIKIDDLVDITDLFPTLLQIAGIAIPDYAQGFDLLKWVRKGAKRPLRKYLFAQVGDYHGHLQTTFPGGMPAIGRHPGLLMNVRTREFSYIHDPDFGDEAYDLTVDPNELNNLLNYDLREARPEISELQRQARRWEKECLTLRNRLGIIPGYRGFDVGWESLSAVP